jgi:hypothetical protein
MKMMLLVFRNSLEEEVLHLLKSLEVKAFTEAPEVLGMGETESAFSSSAARRSNSMILAALEQEQADKVVKGLKAFRNQLSQQEQDAKIPIRAFLLPCEQVI